MATNRTEKNLNEAAAADRQGDGALDIVCVQDFVEPVAHWGPFI